MSTFIDKHLSDPNKKTSFHHSTITKGMWNIFNFLVILTGGFLEKVKGEEAKPPQDHHLDQQRVRQDS